ncbi:MAG: DUF3500 domain-containing protein [Bacteroidota bacterium]
MPRTLPIITLCLLCSFPIHAQDIVTLAEQFSASLEPKWQKETFRPLDDAERYNWHFVPLLRQGSSLANLNDTQDEMAMGLLQRSLSPTGLVKAKDIMWLENVLKVKEEYTSMPDGSDRRDPEKYHFLVFGKPGEGRLWGWRFEGHHVSLSFLLDGDQIVSATPFFLGSNPGKVDVDGFEAKEVLKKETALGFQLVQSLDEGQRSSAIFSTEAPNDIFSFNHREATPLEPKGVSYANLSPKQKEIFDELFDTYMSNYQFGFADLLREKVRKAGFENLHFAWAGSLTPGAGHYYRIQGPTLLIEYDNTQNGANHVHSVVRDLTNDFGEDILKDHYASEH